MISYFSACCLSDMVTESSWVIFVLFLRQTRVIVVNSAIVLAGTQMAIPCHCSIILLVLTHLAVRSSGP